MQAAFSDEAQATFARIEAFGADFKELMRDHDGNRNPKDLRDQALMVQACRFIKFLESYLVIARLGHPEPAGALLRSLYEATVWARWVVSTPERAQRYFDAGKADVAKTVMRLVGQGLASVRNAPEPEVFKQMLKADIKANKLPSTDEMAKDIGLSDLHALVYGPLSSAAHGSLLGAGISPHANRVTLEAQPELIEPTLALPHNLARHTAILYMTWMKERRLIDPPDVRGLMGQA